MKDSLKYNKGKTFGHFKKDWIFAALLVSVTIISFFCFKNYMHNNWLDKINEYPPIASNDSLNGVVLYKDLFGRGGGTIIEFESGKKCTVEYARNDLYTPNHFLPDFLQNGDSIAKNADSDSLFIYRDSKMYYFILGKRLDNVGSYY